MIWDSKHGEPILLVIRPLINLIFNILLHSARVSRSSTLVVLVQSWAKWGIPNTKQAFILIFKIYTKLMMSRLESLAIKMNNFSNNDKSYIIIIQK